MASTRKLEEAARYINVGVCVPSHGGWVSQFGRSLVMAAADFMNWKPDPKDRIAGKVFQLLNVETSMLVQSRHNLVRGALNAKCTHILFLDADMKFPRDIIRRMLLRDKDILGANATTRVFPVTPIAHDMKGSLVSSKKKYGLQKVRQVGLAVMMIKAEVFKKIQPPFFMMDWTPAVKAYSGEDVYFCQVAQAAGYDIFIDHDLSKEVGHCGKYIYGWEDVGRVMDPDKDGNALAAFAKGEEDVA